MKTLCIVPVYNEQDKINKLLSKIKKFKNRHKNYCKFIFFNDGSSDKTYQILKTSKLEVINFKKNRGIGYCLIAGFQYAKKNNYDQLVHLAGNGKMNPFHIPRFLKKLQNQNILFVNGSRFLFGGGYENVPFYRVVLIKFYSFFLSIVFNKKITDCSCGFRAFKINIFKNFNINFNKKKFYTYGYEYFSYGKLIRFLGKSCVEIPVTMNYPSKKNYTKIRPIIDWYLMAKSWILGYLDNKPL